MQEKPKQILCIKWGTMYGPEYVNVLYSMISRNITSPFKLFCFTEDTSNIRQEVECLPLPELGCEVPPEATGKWPKQALWAKELFGLKGVALFLDLDSVIVDNLDPYFEYGEPEDVITARNWVKPLQRMAQTSVFRFKIGSHSYMLDNLRKNPQLMVTYNFEQNYVSSCIHGGVKFWPEKWTKHFRYHCMGPWPVRYLRAPKKPKDAKIITFPGKPKPPMAAIGKWSEKDEFRTRLCHLKKCLTWGTKKTGQDKLKRFILPCDWVREHWSS